MQNAQEPLHRESLRYRAATVAIAGLVTVALPIGVGLVANHTFAPEVILPTIAAVGLLTYLVLRWHRHAPVFAILLAVAGGIWTPAAPLCGHRVRTSYARFQAKKPATREDAWMLYHRVLDGKTFSCVPHLAHIEYGDRSEEKIVEVRFDGGKYVLMGSRLLSEGKFDLDAVERGDSGETHFVGHGNAGTGFADLGTLDTKVRIRVLDARGKVQRIEIFTSHLGIDSFYNTELTCVVDP